MPVVRWKLKDLETNATYTVPINPSEMGAVLGRKRVETRATTQGTALLFDGPRQPFELTASGTILDKSHLDNLTTWFKKHARLELTDHLNRKATVIIVAFEARPDGAPQRPWRHTYELTFMVLTDFVYV